MNKAILSLFFFLLSYHLGFTQPNSKGLFNKSSKMSALATKSFIPVLKKIYDVMDRQKIENKAPVKYPVFIYQLKWDTVKNAWGDTLQKYDIIWKQDGTLSSVKFYNNNKMPDSANIFYFSDFVKTKSFQYALENNGMSDYYNSVSNRIEQNNIQLNYIPRSVTIWTTNNSIEQLSSKSIFTSDGIGRITSETILFPDSSNKLMPEALYKFLYDTSGDLNFIKYYSANNNGKWFIIDSFSYIKSYDIKGHITQLVFSDIEGVDTLSMTQQNYILNNDGSIKNLNSYQRGYGYKDWALKYSIDNISWFQFDPKIDINSFGDAFNLWTNFMPYDYFLIGGPNYLTYTYHRGTDYDIYTQGMNPDSTVSHQTISPHEATNILMRDERFTYYPGNDFKSEITYKWDTINSKWAKEWGDSFINNYNSYGDIETSIWKSIYNDTTKFLNLFKTVYSYGATTSIEFETISRPKFNIYPIPTSHYLFIQSGQSLLLNSRIVISDATGKQVLIQDNNNSRAIDVSALLPGFYLISINDGHNMAFSKFIKD
jgi:hypothetical protein